MCKVEFLEDARPVSFNFINTIAIFEDTLFPY